MRPTFLIDSPASLLFGALSAWMSGRPAADTGRSRRWLWRGMALNIVFLGTALWSYALCPDWMWMYFPEDSRTPPGAFIYIILFVYIAPYLSGFYLGRALERRTRHSSLVIAAAGIALNIMIVAVTWDRYRVVGTRAEFLAGTAASLFSPRHPVEHAVQFGGLAMALTGAYLCVMFFRERSP